MGKTTMLDAFREGQEARQRGEPLLSNPHTDKRLREAWAKGWETEDRSLRRS